MIVLTFKDSEEKIFEKAIQLLSDDLQIETVQPVPVPVLSFPGLEIRLHQRRVIRDGKDINLTRLEYGTLTYLTSNAGILLSQKQIFEAVWHLDSDTCHSSVVNVVYSLRKKIEPDRTNPTYIKTVFGFGYKFAVERLSKNEG